MNGIKHSLSATCFFLTFVVSAGQVTAQRPGLSFADQLIPPEFIMEHRAEIGLSDEQHQKIAEVVGQFGTKADSLRRDAEKHNEELSKAMVAHPVDEAKVLEQLEAFLSAERKAQQTHFTGMIRIRNLLTKDQRTNLLKKLSASRDAATSGANTQKPQSTLERRLRGKIAQIQAAMQSKAKSGAPPLDAAELMQQFTPTMNKGRVDEAEAILDRVMKLLDLKPNTNSDAKDVMLEQPPKSVVALKPQSRMSYSKLKQAVAGLHVEDVAWRKIAWETCLLKGIQRSREERKPIVCWVFIDRPIDDERC